MFYAASVRRPGDLQAFDAKVFESYLDAQKFVSDNYQDGDFVHIETCETRHAAEQEVEYQVNTSLGKSA